MHEAVPDPSVVEYPTSDGKPLAETDLHFGPRDLCRPRPEDPLRPTRRNVYVGANMLVYDEPGNPHRHLAPDVFVVFGVPNHRRDLFKIWEEKPPSFVLEVTSKSTRLRGHAHQAGALCGVGRGRVLSLRSSRGVPDAAVPGPGSAGRRVPVDAAHEVPQWPTRLLQARRSASTCASRDRSCGCFDPATGRDLRTYEEAERAAQGGGTRRRGGATRSCRVESADSRPDGQSEPKGSVDRRTGAASRIAYLNPALIASRAACPGQSSASPSTLSGVSTVSQDLVAVGAVAVDIQQPRHDLAVAARLMNVSQCPCAVVRIVVLFKFAQVQFRTIRAAERSPCSPGA